MSVGERVVVELDRQDAADLEALLVDDAGHRLLGSDEALVLRAVQAIRAGRFGGQTRLGERAVLVSELRERLVGLLTVITGPAPSGSAWVPSTAWEAARRVAEAIGARTGAKPEQVLTAAARDAGLFVRELGGVRS